MVFCNSIVHDLLDRFFVIQKFLTLGAGCNPIHLTVSDVLVAVGTVVSSGNVVHVGAGAVSLGELEVIHMGLAFFALQGDGGWISHFLILIGKGLF